MATCVVDTVALKGFSSVLNLGITGEVHDTDRPLLNAVKYAANKYKKLLGKKHYLNYIQDCFKHCIFAGKTVNFETPCHMIT